ncbi:TPA: hypothetical protein ACOD9W_004493, partial [Stenotrophomonas maltophilia]
PQALSAGENVMRVSRQMGLRDWTITARKYGRWIPSMVTDAGAKATAAWIPSSLVKRAILSNLNDRSIGMDGDSIDPGNGAAPQKNYPDEEDMLFIRSPEEFTSLLLAGWIVDARSGGLVRGRLHEEGHIPMVQHVGPLGTFRFMGFMEGGEYILSTDATAAHRGRLIEINSDKAPCDTPLPEPPPGRVIDASAEPHDRVLLIEHQFIVNRVSTRRHLAELVALNAPHRYYRGQYLSDEVVDYLNSHP